MSLTNGQLSALYILLATRSDFRLKFEGKLGGAQSEKNNPVPVNTTVGDNNYITTRFFKALNDSFHLNLTYTPGDADDVRVKNLYDVTGTDIGNPSTNSNPRTTNITRNHDVIRNQFDVFYDPSDPCPPIPPQTVIWNYYNPAR